MIRVISYTRYPVDDKSFRRPGVQRNCRGSGIVDCYRFPRPTIEVAYFRYFVCERRGFLTPNLWKVSLDFEKNTGRFLDLGHGIIRRDAF